MSALQASRRASPALIRPPVDSPAAPSSVDETVVVDGHQHRGRVAALPRQSTRPLLQHRGERLRQQPGIANALPRVRVHPRDPRGDGREVGTPRGDVGLELGHPEVHGRGRQVDDRPGQSAAQVVGGDLHPLAGVLLLALEQAALVLVGDLGSDHLQDPAAQHPQPARLEVDGKLHQPALGSTHDVRRQVAGQVVQRADDLARRGTRRPCPHGRRRRRRGCRWLTASASRWSRRPAALSRRVSCASQAPADRAPASSATSPATATTASRWPSSRVISLVSPSSSSRFASVDR